MSDDELFELSLHCYRAAIDAGKAIMDIYTDPASDFEIERKADNSPLTKADKAAHKLIMNVLSRPRIRY